MPEAKAQTKKPTLKLDSLELKPSDNGGWIVRCYKSYDRKGRPSDMDMGYVEPTVNTFDKFYDAVYYMADEAGEKMGDMEDDGE